MHFRARFWRQRFVRFSLASALVAATLGAASHPKAHAARARPALPFPQAGRDGAPVAAAVRRVQIEYTLSHAAGRAAALVRSRPAAVKPASRTYEVVNLDAILSGFTPTALNNDGRIVGTATTGDPDGIEYSSAFINNNGFAAPLPPDQYCGDDDLNANCFTTPTAITNKSGAAAGALTEDVQYGCCSSATYTGVIVWNLGATSATINYADDGQTERPRHGEISSIADQNIAVGGRFYNGYTPFPIETCRISNFYALSINDAGVIVGQSNGRAAALTLGGCPAYVPNVPPNSYASIIADDGDMLLGFSGTANSAVWHKGQLVPILLPSGYSAAKYAVEGLALNDNGIVVGVLDPKNGSNLPAVAFEYAAGRSVDVTSLFPAGSGWSALSAVGINDRNEIIGQGMYKGAVRGFALRY